MTQKEFRSPKSRISAIAFMFLACVIAGSLGYEFAHWRRPRGADRAHDFLISAERMGALTAARCEVLSQPVREMLDIANSIVSTWPPEDEVVNGFDLGGVTTLNSNWCKFPFASGSDLYINARSVAHIVGPSAIRIDVYTAIDAALECDDKPSFSISVIKDRGKHYAFDTRHGWLYRTEQGHPRRVGSNQ